MKFKKVIESGIIVAFALTIASTAAFSSNVPVRAAYEKPEKEFAEETSSEETETATIEKTEINLVAQAAVYMQEAQGEATDEEDKAEKVSLEKEDKADIKSEADIEDKADIIDTPAEMVTQEVSPWAEKLMPNVEEYLNIRMDAADDAEVAGKIYKGAVAEIVEQGDTWTKIKSGSVEGYVKNEFCLTGLEAENLAHQQGTTYATAISGGVRVRAAASVAEDTEILDVMEEGGKLKVDKEAEAAEGWVAVKCSDKTGYVSAEFVTVELELGKAISIEEERAAIEAAEAEKAKKAQRAAGGTQQKGAVTASVDDVTLLGALIQCEAGSESYEGQVAVGAVVMNRLRAGYAGSISGVIYQSGQFSPASSGKLNSVIANGVSGSCLQAAQAAIGGADNVNGAKSFRRASSGQPGIVIGNHVFF